MLTARNPSNDGMRPFGIFAAGPGTVLLRAVDDRIPTMPEVIPNGHPAATGFHCARR
jgi:hypothetical protein